MKCKFLLRFALVLTGLFSMLSLSAQNNVNLTPMPAQMTVGTGNFTLPTGFTVSTAGLNKEMTAEVENFIATMNATTTLNCSALADTTSVRPTIAVSQSKNSELGTEGYTLYIFPNRIQVAANSPIGIYYAFLSIKKMLPANVLAGVKRNGAYTLPVVTIKDMPRYDHRGFMLDVSRHFFGVAEIKKMLDVMSYYKLNRFHFHLTDDQGWRFPVDKYPKLTTIGATAPNSRFTDMYAKTQYWINRQYGPFSYTKDELRELVAYAAARHIEIIPEVEFPGHMAAAMAAYPEFSCNPNGGHSVWSSGGISSDVLNIGNPAAIQFAKDVLNEVMEIFPSEYIHIGGDECPSTAWESNAECQQLYQQLNLSSYRALQSYFTNLLGEHVAKQNRKLIVWNESITAAGSDIPTIKQTDPTIMCWYPAQQAANTAQNANLQYIYTAYVPFYINRKYSDAGIPGAGNGDSDPQVVYNHATPDNSLCRGIQATFWCEHVSDNDYLEFLALPRLIIMGENAWTPQANKNYADFQRRFTADKELLDLGNYKYNQTHMLGNTGGSGNETGPLKPEKNKYYKLVSTATDDRANTTLQLLQTGSDIITQKASYGAQVNRLWVAAALDESSSLYDTQFWRFDEDPNRPGYYAIVCKASPNGSVKPNPTATSTAGRWDYDPNNRYYEFTLPSEFHNDGTNGEFINAITSTSLSSLYMNASKGGQGYAANVYASPADGNGGLWKFVAPSGATTKPSFTPLTQGKTYTLFSYGSEFDASTTIVDRASSTYLSHSTSPWDANCWTVVAASVTDGVQKVTLRNVATNRFIATTATAANGTVGYPVSMGATGAEITLSRVDDSKDNVMTLSIGDKTLWPVDVTSTTMPGIITSGTSDSAYPNLSIRQGTAWLVKEVTPKRFVCVTDKGESLGEFQRGIAADDSQDLKALAPQIKNFTITSATANGDVVNCTYTRSAVTVTYECRDELGAILGVVPVTANLGQNHTVAYPSYDFYSFVSGDQKEGVTITPTYDITIKAVYSTSAASGVARRAEEVTTLLPNRTYLIYDAASDAARVGFRFQNEADGKLNASTSEIDGSPAMAWVLRPSGQNYLVQNRNSELYVPAMISGNSNPVGTTGEPFSFTYADGSWSIRGTSNTLYWNGNAGDARALAGWSTPHPYRIFEYYAQPFFKVTITCIHPNGNTISTTNRWVKAGGAYYFAAPIQSGLYIKSIDGADGLDRVTSNKNIVVTYSNENSGVSEIETGNNANSAIYDLAGRRLKAITAPGIYIVNGTKVIVK